MKTLILLSSLGLAAFSLVGCAGTGAKSGAQANLMPAGAPVTVHSEIPAALLQPGSAPTTLGPGDIVEVQLLDSTSQPEKLTVGPDGKVYFNLLPGIDVWGLTLAQTRARLEKDLANYQKGARVSVTLQSVGSKQVWLLGRLEKPGIYPMTAPMTLLEGIAMAGGTSRSESQISTEELSDLRHSFVVRKGKFLPVNFDRLLRHGDMSQNIYLQPGDFVYVPFALNQEVYVMGAVRYPRAIPYVDQMNLVSAIAGSAGMLNYDIFDRQDNGVTTMDADLAHVAIVRGSLSQPQVFIVNFNDIVKGRAPNVLLEPGDIVNVPNSPFTTLKRYVNLIVNTFTATVAANEGVRAGGGEVGVGVSVPVGR